MSWPLQTTLTLGALPTAAGCARLHARNVISGWGQAALADNVELVVSELVTNAILASTYPDGRPRYEERACPVGMTTMLLPQLRPPEWCTDRAC